MSLKDTIPKESIPEIGLAEQDDLGQIVALQKANLAAHVDDDEKKKQGFVSLETSLDQLSRIAHEEGIIVARIEGNVVGYLMPMTVEHGKEFPLLDPFIARFPSIQIDNRYLTDYAFCIIGQVCISKDFRGRGILENLYAELKHRLKGKYEIAITEISAGNPRSLHAHQKKVGLKVAESYSANGMDWYVVYLDLVPKLMC